jgi:predicted P-loop ATPase
VSNFPNELAASAIEHLSTLGYTDGDTVYYRAIKKLSGEGSDSQKRSGVFPLTPSDLQKLNSNGYSIYVVVNGGGDSDPHVSQGKAIFYEHDDLEKEQQLYLWQSLNLPEPTIQIDTGGKSIHSYWVFDAPIDIDKWRSLQADLLNYSDGDRSIKNPSRVMRLAGFKHPATGNISEIISHSSSRYDYETIRSIVPVPEPQPRRNPQPFKANPKPKSSSIPSAIPIERLLTAEHRSILTGTSQGGRNAAGASLARDLIGVAAMGSIVTDYRDKNYTLQIGGNAEELFNNFCDGCSPPLSHHEGAEIWRKALKSDHEPCIQDIEILQNCARSFLKDTLPKRGRPTADKPKSDKDYQDIARKLGIKLSDNGTDKAGEPNSKLLKLKLDLFDMFESRIEFNEMSREIELDRKPLDLNLAKDFCSSALEYDSSTENCIIALNAIAIKFKYHPVREYLESLREKATDLSLITNFPKRYWENENELQNRLFFRKLVATVARVMSPGAKDDSLLVLQGKQGAGKSTALKALAGDDWFNDDLRSLDDKDEIAKLSRFWLLELAEVDYLFGKKEVELFKRFLSCTEDTFRPPYGRANILVKRTCGLFASTNKSEFLSDPTGDRRYWVVEVKKDIDIEAIRQDRDLIWATALAVYERGEQHYLTEHERQEHTKSNTEWRDDSDPWGDPILAKINSISKKHGSIQYVSIQNIMDQILHIPLCQQDKRQRNRIGNVLQVAGFERKCLKIDGKNQKVWGLEISGDERGNTCDESVAPSSNPSNPSQERWVAAEISPLTTGNSSNPSNPSLETIDLKLNISPELGEIVKECELKDLNSTSTKKMGYSGYLGSGTQNSTGANDSSRYPSFEKMGSGKKMGSGDGLEAHIKLHETTRIKVDDRVKIKSTGMSGKLSKWYRDRSKAAIQFDNGDFSEWIVLSDLELELAS